ncbi:tetratricopeptide repeat protein [Planotetraspora kaengkrachanensis]|nr:tetratricopeptide repeat protein [Planotetraspora kaengkrachanensis]
MDPLNAVAAVVGVVALGVGIWQLRVAIMDRRDARSAAVPRSDPEPTGTVTSGSLPVVAPLGRLPVEVVGRDDLLAELRRALGRRRGGPPGVWVLAGMGGVGKSTIALWLAAEARRLGRPVWWVNAADSLSLRGGSLEILRQLGAPEWVAREVRDAAPTAADRFWTFLDGPSTVRRGLLIFDNADAPELLSADGVSTPADGTGWIRPSRRVLTVVTTRNGEPGMWGNAVHLRPLKVLDDVAAASVLRALAPQVADSDGSGARALARRLGALPLALHLAGTYLASPFARWRDFDDYRQALDGGEGPEAIAELDSVRTEARATVSRTWELSLDALAGQGLVEARGLLYVLSCFAPSTAIPTSIMRTTVGEESRRTVPALRGLAEVGLLDVGGSSSAAQSEVTVHPVVADTCRARLLAPPDPDGPDGASIMAAPVRLLRVAAEELDKEQPEDWPSWERLIPHVAALVTWIARHLDTADLSALLTVGREALTSLWLNGGRAAYDREALARANLRAAGRLGDDHPDRLAALNDLAGALDGRGRHREAEDLFGSVLTGRRRVLGDENVETLLTRDHLVGAILAQGRFGEAEQMYRDLITDMGRTLGAEHRETLTTSVDLAWSIGMQGRAEEAAEICRRVLDAGRRVIGAEHPRTLDAWADLARWTGERGEHEQSEEMCRELLEVERRVLGARHPLTMSTETTLARALAGQGRFGESEKLLRDLLAEMEQIIGAGDARAITARSHLADGLAAQGRTDEAKRIYQHVLELQQLWMGDEHPETVRTRQVLAAMAVVR